ncbi:lysozyme inhibitor LprI family protein [Ancylobacter terrae]|uniref:lysozyme inhibitor LprI family protein n=1 Tax=Ancylobacter sp. sgz301288 TaxID=3342077 RepID=UPI00385EBD09
MRAAARALILAALVAAPARAQQAPPAGGSVETCRRPQANPRERLDCLAKLQGEGERRLDRVLAGTLAAIRATEAAAPPQRARWANLMEESQGRFVLWRNFECQSLAPYEGEGGGKSVGGRIGGTGALEQRLVCLVELNDQRANALERRYPAPPGFVYAEPPPPAPAAPAPAPAATRIIDLPR